MKYSPLGETFGPVQNIGSRSNISVTISTFVADNNRQEYSILTLHSILNFCATKQGPVGARTCKQNICTLLCHMYNRFLRIVLVA